MMRGKRFTDEANEISDKIADAAEAKMDVFASSAAPEPEPEPVKPGLLAQVDELINAVCVRYSSGGGCPLEELRKLQRDVAALGG